MSVSGLELALSLEANFLVVSIVFSTLPEGSFFPFLAFGVGATLGIVGIFLVPDSVPRGFFFCGGGSRYEFSTWIGLGVISIDPPSTLASSACIIIRIKRAKVNECLSSIC